MKYCMNCGVKIDENKHRKCPLCETIILTDKELAKLANLNKEVEQEIEEQEKIVRIKKEQRYKKGYTSFIMLISSLTMIFALLIVDLSIGFNISWSIIPIISIICFLLIVNLPFMIKKSLYWFITVDGIVLCLYFLNLNLLINQQITWSYYVVLSIILVWIYLLSIFVNKIKNITLKIAIDFLGTAIFVLLVSLGLGNPSVFSQLALPINGLVFILTVISYLFIKTYIYNLSVVITTLSINLSILCLGIDLLIQHYLYDEFSLNWSYIVLLVLIPISILMIYLNNRYKINKYLIRKFHI